MSTGPGHLAVNGVAVGTAAIATGDTTNFVALYTITNTGSDLLTGFGHAPTAAEWLYLYNGGSFLPYASMSMSAGGGAGAVQQRQRLLLLEGQSA